MTPESDLHAIQVYNAGFRRFDDSWDRNSGEDKGCAGKGCLPRSRARSADLAVSILRTVGSSNVAAAMEGIQCRFGADSRLDDPRGRIASTRERAAADARMEPLDDNPSSPPGTMHMGVRSTREAK